WYSASWVGRHLTLQYPHYNVVCFDQLDYCASLSNINYVDANCNNSTFVKGDITNSEQVLAVLHDHNIDTIFHLAAQSHVDLSLGCGSFEFTPVNVYDLDLIYIRHYAHNSGASTITLKVDLLLHRIPQSLCECECECTHNRCVLNPTAESL
ncbi:hypothetical protein V1512DRAFT_268316, partial [Lipomyces arxii]|uniref:uncharacterized protein n=1 Tax=Lipomyces arxii TaxID=56418 RepID=UPI0034CEC0C7